MGQGSSSHPIETMIPSPEPELGAEVVESVDSVSIYDREENANVPSRSTVTASDASDKVRNHSSGATKAEEDFSEGGSLTERNFPSCVDSASFRSVLPFSTDDNSRYKYRKTVQDVPNNSCCKSTVPEKSKDSLV